MARKNNRTLKAAKAKAAPSLPELRAKGVSKAASQNLRGGGINRIVVTDGKINP